MTQLKPIRFSIRSLLLLAALIAVYLGWRLRNPESQVITVINNTGGRAVLGCNFEFIVEGSKPGRSQTKVITNSNPIPPISLSELVFGDGSDRRVRVVELPLEKITTELADSLMTLSDMQILIVEIPGNETTYEQVTEGEWYKVIDFDKIEDKLKHRLAELQATFGNRLRCH